MDQPLKASELKAIGVDTAAAAGELWRPLSDDGSGEDVRPSGNNGEVPRTDEEGGFATFLRDEREARGVSRAEDWRVRRLVGDDMCDGISWLQTAIGEICMCVLV